MPLRKPRSRSTGRWSAGMRRIDCGLCRRWSSGFLLTPGTPDPGREVKPSAWRRNSSATIGGELRHVLTTPTRTRLR